MNIKARIIIYTTTNTSLICLYISILFCSTFQSAYAEVFKHKNNKVLTYLSIGQASVKANELVYAQPPTYPANHKLSHLIWETKNIPMMMAGMRIIVDKKHRLNIEAQFNVAKESGVMDDYDWIYYNLDWSHWSHHEDTQLTDTLTLDINFDATIYENKGNKVSILVGYKKESWSWKSRGGSYIYSSEPYDSPDSIMPTRYRDLSGTITPGLLAISYEQEFSMPYFGIKYESVLDKWNINLQYDYSTLVNVSSVDHHHIRSLIFKDDFEKGVMNSFKFKIGYQLDKNFDIHLKYISQNYEEVRGNTTYIDSNTGSSLGRCVNCAGADNSNETWFIGTSFSY